MAMHASGYHDAVSIRRALLLKPGFGQLIFAAKLEDYEGYVIYDVT